MKHHTYNLKELLTIYGPAIIIIAAGFYYAQSFIQPAPPRSLIIAAGQPGGAYHAFATKYAGFLAKEKIKLDIRVTAGSMENIGLLNSGAVDLAFIQGGTVSEVEASQIEALGSIYFEPLWLFHRSDLSLDRMSSLENLRVAIGPPGSGTLALVSKLLAENQLDDSRLELLELETTEAARQLESGSLDAAFFVSRADSDVINTLIHSKNLALASFERARAYETRLRYLSALTLPEGSQDLVNNLPGRDIHLIAPTASLTVNSEIHPAIVDLMMQGLTEVHYPGGIFESEGEFPSAKYLDIPLHERAAHYYQNGQPFLQRYLPFWAASIIDRLKIMILPIIALLIPLVKVMPPLFQWRMISGIRKLYKKLSLLDRNDSELRKLSGEELKTRLHQLAGLDEEALNLNVPASLSDRHYHLRAHIAQVKANVEKILRLGG